MQYTNHILKRHWCTTRDLQVSFGCLPDTQVAFSRRDFYMHFIEFLLGRSQFSHKQCLMTLKLIYWSIYSRQSITIVCRPLYPDRSSCDEFSVQMWILFIISRTILCHDKPLSMCWTVFENNQSRIKIKNPGQMAFICEWYCSTTLRIVFFVENTIPRCSVITMNLTCSKSTLYSTTITTQYILIMCNKYSLLLVTTFAIYLLMTFEMMTSKIYLLTTFTLYILSTFVILVYLQITLVIYRYIQWQPL